MFICVYIYIFRFMYVCARLRKPSGPPTYTLSSSEKNNIKSKINTKSYNKLNKQKHMTQNDQQVTQIYKQVNKRYKGLSWSYDDSYKSVITVVL